MWSYPEVQSTTEVVSSERALLALLDFETGAECPEDDVWPSLLPRRRVDSSATCDAIGVRGMCRCVDVCLANLPGTVQYSTVRDVK